MQCNPKYGLFVLEILPEIVHPRVLSIEWHKQNVTDNPYFSVIDNESNVIIIT